MDYGTRPHEPLARYRQMDLTGYKDRDYLTYCQTCDFQVGPNAACVPRCPNCVGGTSLWFVRVDVELRALVNPEAPRTATEGEVL